MGWGAVAQAAAGSVVDSALSWINPLSWMSYYDNKAISEWQKDFAERTFEQQQQNWQAEFDYQKHLAENGYQIKAADLAAAGINPILASGMTGMGGQAISPNTGSSGQANSVPYQQMMQRGSMMETAARLQQAEAQVDLMKSESEKNRAEADTMYGSGGYYDRSVSNQERLSDIQAELKRNTITVGSATVKLFNSEARLNDFRSATESAQKMYLKARELQAGAETAFTNTNTQYVQQLKAESEKRVQHISEEIVNLRQEWQRINASKDNLESDTAKKEAETELLRIDAETRLWQNLSEFWRNMWQPFGRQFGLPSW